MRSAISIKNIVKKYKGFTLNISDLHIPEGFATALIGENGAGKSTLMNILSGVRLDYKGEMTFFEKYTDRDRENESCPVREDIGYTAPNNYFIPSWSIDQVRRAGELLFDKFDGDKFNHLCTELGIVEKEGEKKKKVTEFSDGNKMKIMIASALARETKMLIMDEPASPLDPLMRDRLCEMIHEYIEEGAGERTVLFSTHNIADMENVTDYAIIMEHGQVIEQGFVEDLKEKYIMVKGEIADVEIAEKALYSISKNKYGFEGICLAENVDQLSGLDVILERPSLSQISVAIMKEYSKIAK